MANWQSLAGVGTELKKERERTIEEQELKFNPVLYGMQNEDEQCSFIKQWLPCFGGLPNVFVHEPWKTPESIKIPKCYRSPVVDPAVFATNINASSPPQQNSDKNNITSPTSTAAINNNPNNNNAVVSQISSANQSAALQQQILENQLLMRALEQQKQRHQQQQQQENNKMDDD